MTVSILKLGKILTRVVKASRVMRYYPPDHPQIAASLGTALEELRGFVDINGTLVLDVREDGLYLGPAMVYSFITDEGLFSRNLLEFGVEEIRLMPGIDAKELVEFVELLSQASKDIGDRGGLSDLVKPRKWAHLKVAVRDFSVPEGEALVDTLERELTEEDRKCTVEAADQWLLRDGEPPSSEGLASILALTRAVGATGYFILSLPGATELAPEDYLAALHKIWTAVVGSNLDLPATENRLAAEFLSNDPTIILDVISTRDRGRELSRLMERFEGSTVGELIGNRVVENPSDTRHWIEVIREIFQTGSSRKSTLYDCVGFLRGRDGLKDAMILIESALGESSKEESIFIPFLRGAFTERSSAPHAWEEGRWERDVFVRRAMGLLERFGLTEHDKRVWVSRELDRELAKRDADSVLGLLEGTRDRSISGTETDAESVISSEAMQLLPRFMQGLSSEHRNRFVGALVSVEKRWRGLVAQMLDSCPEGEINELGAELELGGIDLGEMTIELLRNDNPEDIARAARIIGAIGSLEQRAMLFPLLEHGNPWVRVEVIKVLSKVEPEEMADLVPQLAKDTDPLVLKEVMSCAKSLPEIAQVLVRSARSGWLRTVDEGVGFAAVEILSEVGSTDEKAEFAAIALSSSFLGRSVASGIKEAARSLIGEEERRGIWGVFKGKKKRGEDPDV